MTSVAILPITNPDGQTAYQAISGDRYAIGKTAGEALDALNDQLPDLSCAPLMLFQSFQGDRFFNATQKHCLAELMQQWRNARDQSQALEMQQQREEKRLARHLHQHGAVHISQLFDNNEIQCFKHIVEQNIQVTPQAMIF
ncbi:MAG: hypothetical protein F6J87_10895 [Spirulina sp. SIO3F2]|nr:hypothetical protein [Spirulina sp. SIO3F2]